MAEPKVLHMLNLTYPTIELQLPPETITLQYALTVWLSCISKFKNNKQLQFCGLSIFYI